VVDLEVTAAGEILEAAVIVSLKTEMVLDLNDHLPSLNSLSLIKLETGQEYCTSKYTQSPLSGAVFL